MANYYYLAAQLPSISINSQPAMNFDSFKELACRFLTKKDVDTLEKLSLEPPRQEAATTSDYLDRWYNFERSLRLALEQVRSSKLNWEASISYDERILLNSSFSPVQIARSAAAIENLLEAEIFLNTARFNAADLIRGDNAFSSDAIFAYAIKLLLCERIALFDVKKGKEEYSSLYNAILTEKK